MPRSKDVFLPFGTVVKIVASAVANLKHDLGPHSVFKQTSDGRYENIIQLFGPESVIGKDQLGNPIVFERPVVVLYQPRNQGRQSFVQFNQRNARGIDARVVMHEYDRITRYLQE